MAKITYSALVSRLSGSLGGSTFARWKGINVIKRKIFRPRQLFNFAQQNIRNIMSWLAGSWYALSAAKKVMWNTYASLLTGHMSGINAFIRNNTLLLYCGIKSTITDQPPPTPDTPDMFTVLACGEALGVTTFTWTLPAAANLYAVVDRCFMVGLDDGSHPRWAYLGKAATDTNTFEDTHGLAAGTIVRYRVRVADEYGRVSPWSQTFTVTATIPTP
jgi:hypothetical protein